MADRQQVTAILQTITLTSGQDIVTAGLVRALGVSKDGVRFVLEVPPGQSKAYSEIKNRAEDALRKAGFASVQIGLSEESPPDLGAKPKPKAPAAQQIPGVAHVIAVASGKGGVGKSTLSANLACALAQAGRRVGLLDADVYGPSQPRMMGITGRPSSPDGKKIIPLQNHGVTMMSMGLMVETGQAVVWRGPMLMGALQQMLFQVEWGELDVLIVDLPPGTGDVQMTLAQKTMLDGAIIVSTPQDVALIDARKGIDMFHKLNVPILGMVENMSHHICTNCGHEEAVFGRGGVRAEAEKLGVPILGELPLDLQIRIASDNGAPIVIDKPKSPQAAAYMEIAKNIVSLDVA